MIPAQRVTGQSRAARVWLFDLDNTLHDASRAAFPQINEAMTRYIQDHLALPFDKASELRTHYWHRYGATLLGLTRHHGVDARHFLEKTHQLPGLEARLRMSPSDRAALKRLRGRKFVVTNAPRHYALRVLETLDLLPLFDGLICVEEMTLFGHLRPKPDARMFRHLIHRLGASPTRCVLVEDTLVHQRQARRCGMQTVWMQRYLPQPLDGHPLRQQRKPPYVSARIRKLRELGRMTRTG